MKKLLLSAIAVAAAWTSYSQCTLTTIASEETVTCGDCVNLSAFGNGSGNIAFQENFNSGSPSGWAFTQSVTIGTNTCGVPSPDGSPFMWMGDNAVNPRDMTTVNFNLTLGGTICFDMRYSVQGDATPCEGPDEPDEGVYLQYSTNNGTTWTTIQYYDPDGGYNTGLTSWNQYCAILPPGALTASTKIRWHQDDVSGAEFDHWGIDNVIITLNDPSFQITWLHDGYAYPMGSGGGINPTPVCPQNTTTYTAQISNGTTTCTSAITVTVTDPVIIIDAGNDTTLCTGDCATLNAEAYELVSPASTPTFDNSELSPVTSGHAEMNINVQGLNATTVTPGSITSICLNSFNFSGSQLCTSFSGCNCNGSPISFGSMCNLNVSSFNITVTSPGGCDITLVPSGTAIGTSYTNVCFVPAGGQSISLPSFPTPGNWAPQENFSALNGCQSNGLWTMEVDAPGGFGFGIGFLNGWSITFDDPEITAPVNFTWSPTTAMTNSTTLSPTVCPTTTTTYTLTATDTDGCTTVTDQVTVSTGSCCALTIDNLAPGNPSCGASDGTITATVSGQITGLEFSIDGGTTFQSSNVFSGLAAGTYTIQATDDNNCLEIQTITLTSGNAPVISSTSVTNASCGASDGQIAVTATGGSGTLTYSSDNGTTFQAGSTLTGLAAGTYTVVVEDAGGCQATATATVTNANGPSITATAPVNPGCGASDGSISITASGGTGTLQYSIDNGATFQAGNVFSGLAAGTFTLVVQDASGCQATGSETLINANGPAITTVTPVNPGCSASDGSISIAASGGTGTLQYSTDNGTTFQPGSSFTNLAGGTYAIVVEDASGCQATASQTLTAGTAPAITTVTTTSATCGSSDGSVTINASGGSGTLQYSIDNGATFQSGSIFSGLASGSYTIVVQDAGGCQDNDAATVTNLNGPTVNAGADQVVCAGDPVTLSGSSPASLTYTWNNGVVNGAVFIPASTTTYTVTGTDINGCTATDQVLVTVNSGLAVSVVPNITSGCAPLTVTFDNTTLNSVNCNWVFSDGTTFNSCSSQTVTFDDPGCYNLTLTAQSASGCAGTATFTNIVCVSDAPTASFTPNPSVITLNDPVSIMNNNSSGGVAWNWNFGDGSPNSSDYSPAHVFPASEPGSYTVTLTVVNADGCSDAATGTVVVEEDLVYFVPNAFTPDGDEFNQVFQPVFTTGFDPSDFNMTIFNRWGEIVFETEDHAFGWDGSYNGLLVPEGVYTWKIEFKILTNDERKSIIGHLNVLK